MADDWAPGDLALCVRDDWGDDAPQPSPKRGETAKVEDIGKCVCGCGSLYLAFPRWCPFAVWSETGFKKINPLTDEERDEFLTGLRINERTIEIVKPLLPVGRHDVGYR